jgi:hypothetical protein
MRALDASLSLNAAISAVESRASKGLKVRLKPTPETHCAIHGNGKGVALAEAQRFGDGGRHRSRAVLAGRQVLQAPGSQSEALALQSLEYQIAITFRRDRSGHLPGKPPIGREAVPWIAVAPGIKFPRRDPDAGPGA